MGPARLTGAILLLCLCAWSELPAQVETPTPEREASLRTGAFGLGFFASPAGGIGLSFRHHLPGRFSYQVTGGIIKASDHTSSSIGGEIQYTLARAPQHRIFAVAATGYYYSGPPGRNDMEAPWRLGVGVGGELAIGGGFTVMGDLLFTYFSDGALLPVPGAGVFYYFD
jgi:hypothetical protein